MVALLVGMQSLLTLRYFLYDRTAFMRPQKGLVIIACITLLLHMLWLFFTASMPSLLSLLPVLWLPLLTLCLLLYDATCELLLFLLPSVSLQVLSHAVWLRFMAQSATFLPWLHYYMALFTCSILIITALLSAVYALQLLSLKATRFHRWIDLLPALQTLERFVGLTFAYGFTVLTVTFASGIYWQWLMHEPMMTMKAGISAAVWFVFALLGFGWMHLNWRGLKVWSILWLMSIAVIGLFMISSSS